MVLNELLRFMVSSDGFDFFKDFAVFCVVGLLKIKPHSCVVAKVVERVEGETILMNSMR